MREEDHVVARSRLRQLVQDYPRASHQTLANQLGYSRDWVKKWRRRLNSSDPHDEQVVLGQSRRCQHYTKTAEQVVKRIGELRESLVPVLRRTPGPKAILYYLHEQADLKAAGIKLPTASSTIWRILVQGGYCGHATHRVHQPVERPDPLQGWAMDFKDIATIPAEPDGKRQHGVEILNIVDEGTSIWLDYHVRTDFCAETTILMLTQTFRKLGLPQTLRMDRDPRFVGNAGLGDFPATAQRFLSVLGVQTILCPPRHPQKNPFVERLHGNIEAECLLWERPASLEKALPALEHYHLHYLNERPHQGNRAGNRPLAQAFPILPALPRLPEWVDPERWLWRLKGRHFIRRVQSNGSIVLDNTAYYLKRALAGQTVLAWIDPASRELVVYHRRQLLKRLPLKGLFGQRLPFDDYLVWILKQAHREDRWRLTKRRGRSARTR